MTGPASASHPVGIPASEDFGGESLDANFPLISQIPEYHPARSPFVDQSPTHRRHHLRQDDELFLEDYVPVTLSRGPSPLDGTLSLGSDEVDTIFDRPASKLPNEDGLFLDERVINAPLEHVPMLAGQPQVNRRDIAAPVAKVPSRTRRAAPAADEADQLAGVVDACFQPEQVRNFLAKHAHS